MKRVIQFALITSAFILALVGRGLAQNQAERDASKIPKKQAEQKTEGKEVEAPLVGTWRAASISMALPDGGRKTLDGTDQPISAIFTATACTIRVGAKIVAELSYVLDSKQKPWTIDMKSAEGELSGICAKRGNRLDISLDDRAQGRPADFDKEKHGMVLALRRFYGSSLLVMNADGSNLKKILTMPDYTFIGSPQLSHSGSSVVFDGWRSVMGEKNLNGHVFTAKADGSAVKDLGPGAMPSWSPDDKQIAYTQYGPQPGVWIMNADGSDRQQIDAGGWGGQWSPRRNEIAYTAFKDQGALLCIYDVARKERRELEHKPYQQIFWHFSWSPGGDWICFKADLPDGGSEIAALSVEGEKKGFKVILPSTALPEVANCYNTLSWGGTGEQILIRMKRKSDRAEKLYILDSSGAKPPQVFPHFPAGWLRGDMAWSWDGKKVIFAARAAEPPSPKPTSDNSATGTITSPPTPAAMEKR